MCKIINLRKNVHKTVIHLMIALNNNILDVCFNLIAQYLAVFFKLSFVKKRGLKRQPSVILKNQKFC